jgi:trk system potassium uptake protein TrkA
MKVAIAGMTLFGRSLALKMTQLGAEVIALDNDSERIAQVMNDVSMAVTLDPTDERELRRQGIHEVDAFASCVDTNFEANLLTALAAKRLGIRRVIARTSTPRNAEILRQVGIDIVVLPEAEAAADLGLRLIMPTLESYYRLIEGFGIAEMIAPKAFRDKAISDLNLAEQYRVNLVAYRRSDPNNPNVLRINVVPKGTDVLHAGDILTLAGNDANLKKISELPV